MAERPPLSTAAEEAGDRATRNTVVRAGGEIVGKLASLVLFVALGRAVGEAGLGVFVFSFAFLQIAVVPIDQGFDRFLLRAIATDRSAVDRLLANVVTLKLVVAGPVLLGAFAVVGALGYDAVTRHTVYALAAGLLLDSLARTLFALFMAIERSELLAASVVVQRVGAAAVGMVALALGFGVVAVALAYTAGAALGFALAVLLVRRAGRWPRLFVAPRSWRPLTRSSLPFGAEEVFTVLLFKLDAVLISLLATDAAVGRYGAAYRLFESTLFITYSLVGAFSAMFAYLGPKTEPTLAGVFQRAVKLTLVTLVPFAVVFGLLPEPLTRALFGQGLVGAANALQLLAPAVVLVGLVGLCSSLIVSQRDPRIMVGLTAVVVVVNVSLNLVLVPLIADRGAAVAMLASEALLALVALAVAHRVVGGIAWRSTFASPLTAGAGMGLTIVAVAAPPLVSATLGALSYVVVFVLVERWVSPDDLRYVRQLIRRRLPASLPFSVKGS